MSCSKNKTAKYNAKKTNSLWSAMIIAAAWGLMGLASAQAQSNSIVRDYGNDDYDGYSARYAQYIEIDPQLEVEIWTDNETGVYYENEEIRIYFRANMDSYVAIYNIDVDGLVNLIYPIDQYDDPYIEGGRIYRIPDNRDDYDLVVRGPAGTENLQIVASRTPMPIPDWYEGSGLVADRDRYEFIDYVNGRYFGCRSGCFRAVDNVSFAVREWDDYYYRPVYYSPYPVWNSYGSLYVDYWWGSSIYIDGYYYGISPLYIPRLYYGHHTVTVYDHYGYAWEGNVRLHNNGPVHLDNTIIRTGAGTHSRYKSVRKSGFLDPARNGYPKVRATSKLRPKSSVSSSKIVRSKATGGATKVVKTRTKTKDTYGYKKVKNTNRNGAYAQTSIERARTDRTKTKSVRSGKSGKSGKSEVSSKSSGKRLRPYKDGPSGKSKSIKGKNRGGKSNTSKVYRGNTRTGDSRKTVKSGSSSSHKSGKVKSRGKSRSSSGKSSGMVSFKKRSSSSKAVKRGKSSSGRSSKAGRVRGKSSSGKSSKAGRVRGKSSSGRSSKASRVRGKSSSGRSSKAGRVRGKSSSGRSGGKVSSRSGRRSSGHSAGKVSSRSGRRSSGHSAGRVSGRSGGRSSGHSGGRVSGRSGGGHSGGRGHSGGHSRGH